TNPLGQLWRSNPLQCVPCPSSRRSFLIFHRQVHRAPPSASPLLQSPPSTMARIAAFLALTASASLVAATPSSHKSSPWGPCNATANLDSPDAEELECAMIQVPLCHDGVCESKQTIELFTQRLLAKQDADNKPNVWLLSGGPGQASDIFASNMIKLREKSKDAINFYTADHRGTGRSANLDCGKDVKPSGYGDCFRKLLAQSDNKPEAFSVTSAAKDVTLLAEKFASKAESYVYGVSYGTYLAERVMHLQPKFVKGYVLDGVSADRGHPFTFTGDDYLPVAKRLAEACEEDKFCSGKFTKEIEKHGSLHQAFTEIVNGFDKAPNDCDLGNTATASIPDATMLYNVIVYSEMWTEPTPTAGRLNANATKTFMWQDQASAVQDYCLVTGRHEEPACQDASMDNIKHLYKSTPAFAYKPDQYHEKVATIPDGVGVMVFNGGLDFNTPWEYGRRQYNDMQSTNILMVEAKHGGHGNVMAPMTPEDTSECGNRIFLSFVANKGDVRKVDTACLKTVPAIQFKNATTAANLLGKKLEGNAGVYQIVSLFTQRLRAEQDADSKPNIWLLSGGPGQDSGFMTEMANLRAIDRQHQRVHAGSSWSGAFLDCGQDLSPSNCGDCFRKVLAQFDKKPEAFFVTSAPHDATSLATKFASNAESYVYGVSYGTYLAQRVMHLSPRAINGYVLDGLSFSAISAMARIATIVVIAASATAHVIATPASHQASPWHPCSANGKASLDDPETNEFECAMIQVPLCHDGVCESKQTIELFTQRLLAKQDADNKPNVWLLCGGPGQPSDLFAGDMLKLRAISNDAINLYTTDHRGTGRSAYLDCGDDLEYSGYGDCFRKLLAQMDNKPESFSVTSAAKDVVHLANQFTTKAESYVYGISYGTYLTERVMHLAPEIVKGYLLDGVSADRGNPFTFMTSDMLPVSKRLAEACEDDEFCRSKFTKEIAQYGSLYEAFIQIVNGFDNSPNRCVDFLVKAQNDEKKASTDTESSDSASMVVKQFLIGFTADEKRVLVPAYLYRINRCSDDDLAFLQTYRSLENEPSKNEPLDEAGSHDDAEASGNDENCDDSEDDSDAGSQATVKDSLPDSDLLAKLIINSEMWTQPSPTVAQLTANSTNAYIWADQAPGVKDYCLVTGRHDEPACQDAAMDSIKHLYKSTPAFVYKRDQYAENVATIRDGVGVVIFNGGHDFNTPWEFGRREFDDLDSPNMMMVEAKHGSHGTALAAITKEDETECGYHIFVSFITNKGDVRKVDISCLDDVPAIQFNNLNSTADLLGERLQGDATFLDCGNNLEPSGYGNCIRKLLAQFENKPEAFSATSATKTWCLWRAFASKANTYIYGVSYGTYLAERVIHLSPASIKGYMLDGPLADRGYPFSFQSADMAPVSKRLAEACEEDEFCCSKSTNEIAKHGSLFQAVVEMVNGFDNAPNQCVDFVQAHMEQVNGLAPAMPASWAVKNCLVWFIQISILYRMNRCSDDDMEFLNEYLKPQMEEDEKSTSTVPFEARILFKLIPFSEFWSQHQINADAIKTLMWPDQGRDIHEYCLFTGRHDEPACQNDALNIIKRLCNSKPAFVYKPDEHHQKVATIPADVGVMVFTGGLDFNPTC
ncbi:TPA: LOW QUALITY PROTEIN: hypothetical protein N0F65_003984, partial [Lagenidium giganteum]